MGRNHLIFNMISREQSKVEDLRKLTQAAILASSSFESLTYRNTFDISVPVFNPLTAHVNVDESLM
jgi:hypothetical protein